MVIKVDYQSFGAECRIFCGFVEVTFHVGAIVVGAVGMGRYYRGSIGRDKTAICYCGLRMIG